MGNQNDPERTTSSEGTADRSEVKALEERVARLEFELARVQRQIAAVPQTPAAAAYVAAPPPPPPPPRPISPKPEEAAAPQRLVSEAWARPAYHPPVAESRDSFESRLGSQIFNRIAIVLLLIGTAYGL